MTLSFMSESRVLDNRRMKRELRVKLACPDVDAVLAQARAARCSRTLHPVEVYTDPARRHRSR
jgi:hypothetical protein